MKKISVEYKKMGCNFYMKNNRKNWDLKKEIHSWFKRLFDIVVSLIGIVIASPIMLIIAIAIKLDSEGPVIFKQERTGKYGKNFMMWKFRTMAANNDVRDKSKADQHTKVGTFLRRTSLDELAQLFSILTGKMSFIGPRPWIPEYFENMTEQQRHRCDVTPGLTGLAQARGRNSISIFDKINNDLEYIDNYGLLEDIYVIFITIKTVLTKEGADAGKGTIHNELEDLKKQSKSKEYRITVDSSSDKKDKINVNA